MSTSRLPFLPLGFFAALPLILSVPALSAGTTDKSLPATGGDKDQCVVPTLTVTGATQLDVAPDELRLSLAVVSEGTDSQSAKEVMNENSVKADKVIKALKALGLGDKEVTTSRFNISPRYSNPNKRGEAPRIVGYRVDNEVRVTTGKIEKAGEFIQAAVDAGANQASSISFGLADERTKRADAIAKATAAARSDAQALAAAAGVTLLRTLKVDLDQPQFVSPQPMYRNMAMAEGAGAPAPPIQPGDVQVSARVTIVYEIGAAEKKVGMMEPNQSLDDGSPSPSDLASRESRASMYVLPDGRKIMLQDGSRSVETDGAMPRQVLPVEPNGVWHGWSSRTPVSGYPGYYVVPIPAQVSAAPNR